MGVCLDSDNAIKRCFNYIFCAADVHMGGLMDKRFMVGNAQK